MTIFSLHDEMLTVFETLRGFSLIISLAPPLPPSYAVTFLLITHSRVVQHEIEELAEQMQQLQLPVQFHGALGQAFALDEGAHVFLSGDDSPDEVAVGHTLLGARRPQLSVAPLHLGLRLVKQPVTHVAVDFAGTGFELGRRDFVQIAAPGRVPNLLAEIARKLLD